MKFIKILSILIFVFAMQSTAYAWYDDWQYQKEITIDHTKVGANLTNFPLLIEITDTGLAAMAQPNGNDILFTDDSDNKLSHEIEYYSSSSGHLIAWVKIPFLSSLTDTKIYMYYKNDAAPNQQNPGGVWDPDYLAVYHLNEISGNVYDSTSNHENGIPRGGLNQNSPGKVGGGDSFDGSNDRIDLAQIFTDETQFTIEAWLNTGNKQGYAFSQRASGNGVFLQYFNGEGNVQLYVNNKILKKPISQNQWVHVVGTSNGTIASLYVNGGTPVSTTASLNWPSDLTYIGDRSTFDRQFLGSLDEVRLSKVPRNVGYIQTSYNNQNDPGTFYSLGNLIHNPSSSLGSITVSPKTVTMNPGGFQLFYATARDQNGNLMPGINISWNSNNKTVGTVTASYDITDSGGNASITFEALNAGAAMVKATNGSLSGNATVTVNPVSNWYNTGWLYRKEIIIDHTKVTADLTNFPLLIDIKGPELHSKTQPSGNDILFTDISNNKLSHEIENYNSATGNLTAWVKIPLLSSSIDTKIYMYYKNDAAPNQQNPGGVWDPNYLAVYHLNEISGNVYDSTSNHKNGIPRGGLNQNSPGKVDGGDSFDGSNDRIDLPQIFIDETQFTIEAWLNTGNKQGYAFSQRASGNGVFLQYFNGERNVQLYVNNKILKKPISQNQWVHVVGTSNGTIASLYVNGGTPVSTTASLNWPSDLTYIGDRSTSDRQFLGSLDEVRLSKVSRNMDYIQTSYNNQNDPGTFYSLGNTIINPSSNLYSITVSPKTVTMKPGEEQLFYATARDQNGNPIPGINISLTSSNKTVGTLSSSYAITDPYGNVTTTFLALDVGTANINAINGSIKGNSTIAVYTDTSWYNHDWLYRKEIIIDHTKVKDDITNFPLLIDLIDPDLHLHAKSNGNDIVFTDIYNNKLSHEIENYNSTSGHLTTWVKIPFLSRSMDTIIYMYYKNDAAPDQQDSKNVWDSNYLAVYHLNETSGNIYDSTPNRNNGIPQGGLKQNSTGIIDGADDFDGMNDYIQMPKNNMTAGRNEVTLEFWANMDEIVGSNTLWDEYYAVTKWQFSVRSDNWYTRDSSTGSGGARNNDLTMPVVPPGEWHQFTLVYSVSQSLKAIYLDGTLFTSTSTSIDTLTNNRDNARIGYPSDGSYFDGKLDEVRLSKVSRTPGYIQTTYNNQKDPDTFYNIGATSINPSSTLGSITVTPSSAMLYLGEIKSFIATARDQNGNPIPGIKISFTVSNGIVGSVAPKYAITDSGGNAIVTFEALAYGNTKLDASNGTFKNNASIIVSKNLPRIYNENPSNNSINVNLNPILSAYVEDLDGDLLDITFSYYNGSQWNILKSYIDQPSGVYSAETAGYMSEPNKLYQWKVTVNDTVYQTEKIFYLKTGNILHLKWKVNYDGGNQAIPLMGDIDNDGVQEIVVSGGGSIKAINGKTGNIEWSRDGSYTNVELIDLNNDGRPEILTGLTSPLRVRAYNGDGTIRWTSAKLKGEILPLFPIIGYDIDGDGYPTIYAATADMTPTTPFDGNLSNYTGSVTMLDHNGNILADTWVYRPCWNGMSIGDVNFDGQFELYVGDRSGPPYYSVPGKGLYALNAHTLQPLWSRSDIITSSPMPIIANVTGDKNLEVIAAFVTNRGVGVLDGMNGNTILDYLNQNLFAHGTGTVHDIDEDGNMEIMFAEGSHDTSKQEFLVFDLISGKRDFQPNISVNIAWPPSAGDVTGDGHMEILAATGFQDNKTGNYPILIYNKKYQLIETVFNNAGQMTPPRVYDVDSDGYNELVVASVKGILSVYDTTAKTPVPAPRTWNQWYSEYRQGAAEYVPPPGPYEPQIKNEMPLNGSSNVLLNPVLSVQVYDFQKDNFNITFEIFTGSNWQIIKSYLNQRVTKFTEFTANSNGYANEYGKTYNWRITVTDSKGYVNRKSFTFIT